MPDLHKTTENRQKCKHNLKISTSGGERGKFKGGSFQKKLSNHLTRNKRKEEEIIAGDVSTNNLIRIYEVYWLNTDFLSEFKLFR